MDDYGMCPSYIQIITTQPGAYLEQANLLTAYALGTASGLLAAIIGLRRNHRNERAVEPTSGVVPSPSVERPTAAVAPRHNVSRPTAAVAPNPRHQGASIGQ